MPLLLACADGVKRVCPHVALGGRPDPLSGLDDGIVLCRVIVLLQAQDVFFAGDELVFRLAASQFQGLREPSLDSAGAASPCEVPDQYRTEGICGVALLSGLADRTPRDVFLVFLPPQAH